MLLIDQAFTKWGGTQIFRKKQSRILTINTKKKERNLSKSVDLKKAHEKVGQSLAHQKNSKTRGRAGVFVFFGTLLNTYLNFEAIEFRMRTMTK